MSSPSANAVRQVARVSLEAQADRLGRAEDLQLESFERDLRLRTMFGKVLLAVAIVANMSTLAMITLTGLDLMRLSDKLLMTLISSTVAELAGLVLVVAKYLFPVPRASPPGAPGVPTATSRGRRGSRTDSV